MAKGMKDSISCREMMELAWRNDRMSNTHKYLIPKVLLLTCVVFLYIFGVGFL